MGENKEALFGVYPKEDGTNLQTVREYGERKRDRKSLPGNWAGKREEELGNLIGIKDAVFCQSARFIAKAAIAKAVSMESILKMAEIANYALEDSAFIAARQISTRQMCQLFRLFR